MALTYPLVMPPLGPATNLLSIDRADLLSREAAGRLGSVQVGFPLWRGEWTLGQALTAEMSDAWTAFLDALEGPRHLFVARDYARPRPAAYLAGLPGGFDGAAASWSQAISDGQALLTLGGLPSALVLSPGDYVDFRWTSGGEDRRSLVRLVEGAVAVSGSVTVSVKPPVPSVTPSGAVAHLDDPGCLMRLDPGQVTLTAMGRRRVAGAKFGAIQDLLP